jgi:hypothetical protein
MSGTRGFISTLLMIAQARWFRSCCALSCLLSPLAVQAVEAPTVNNFPFTATLGSPEQTVLPWGQQGMTFFPDGPISYQIRNKTIHAWFSGGGQTFHVTGPDFDHLTAAPVIAGNAVPVLGPSGQGFDAGYAGSYGVVPALSGSDLLMIYHGEQYPGGPGTGGTCTVEGIGLARSSDGGITWTRQGQIISSQGAIVPCSSGGQAFQGAGNPTVALSTDKQLYLYFNDILNTADPNNPPGAGDGVRLARTSLASDALPGSWLKYFKGSFSQPALGGSSTTLIFRGNPAAIYFGSQSVSYNVYLGRYMMVGMGADGVYYTSSVNGTTWDTPKQLWAVPAITAVSNLKVGDRWVDFISYLTHEQPAHTLTGQSGFLYFAQGTKMANNPFFRNLGRIPVNLTDASLHPAAAVLPVSRSVQVGSPATAFATIVNPFPSTLTGCGLSLLSPLAGNFSFQTTDPATNQLNGTPNTPVSISSNGFQTFLFAFTPSAAFNPTDFQIAFACSGQPAASLIVGVNTLLLSASTTPTPDVIAVGLTPSNDGYSRIPGAGGTGLFVIAATNIGSADTLTARARLSDGSLAASTTICETISSGPQVGQCKQTPSPTVTRAHSTNENSTWGAFIKASGIVPLDPAHNRVFFEFVDANGVVRGSTSTAVTTQ